MPPSRTYASIAVQAEPTWSVSSVQTAPAASPVQEMAVLLPSESHGEQLAVAEEPRVEPEALTPEPPRTPFEDEPVSVSLRDFGTFFLSKSRYQMVNVPAVYRL